MPPRIVARVIATATLLILGAGHGAAAQSVGTLAPWFKLTAVDGRLHTRDSLRGRVVALIVGRTRPSAPPCKKWVIELTRSTGARVLQVIVADKPWYIPKTWVMKEVKGFTPAQYYSQVLVEWGVDFAKRYAVPEDDHPHLFIIDRRGIIRLRLRGKMTRPALQNAKHAISRLLARSRASSGVSPPRAF